MTTKLTTQTTVHTIQTAIPARCISAEEMAFHTARAQSLRAEAMQAFFGGIFSLFRPAAGATGSARIQGASLVTAK